LWTTKRAISTILECRRCFGNPTCKLFNEGYATLVKLQDLSSAKSHADFVQRNATTHNSLKQLTIVRPNKFEHAMVILD